MDTVLTTVALPAALAVIMLGLGLSLTVADFARVGKHPRTVLIALGCQLLILPVVCFALVVAFDLSPLLAVGMMLLAASPGGTTANLFSHLFRGDVALNVTLTAVNSFVALLTLPVITNLAVGYFEPETAGDSVGLQFGKVLQVFAIVLVPVTIGMLVRRRHPAVADRLDKPVRIASAVVLALVILGAFLSELENVPEYFAKVGLIALLFSLISLLVGFVVPRSLSVEPRQAIACSMEIGVHNGTLAIAVAGIMTDNLELAIPAAVYSIVMFPAATLVGWLLTRRRTEQSTLTPG